MFITELINHNVFNYFFINNLLLLKAWINYCCREGYHRQLQTVCLDSLKKYGNDPVLSFWKAFGILQEGMQYFYLFLIMLNSKEY